MLLDTHVLVWFVEGENRLGEGARSLVNQAGGAGKLLVSAITPWEIALLTRKQKIELSRPVDRWISTVLERGGPTIAPLEPAIALDSVMLPGNFHSDPADRIIVATARYREVPLLTGDRAILGYAAKGYLQAIDARL
jgi:PIN domain nuclease of toxin-antitoxin system